MTNWELDWEMARENGRDWRWFLDERAGRAHVEDAAGAVCRGCGDPDNTGWGLCRHCAWLLDQESEV